MESKYRVPALERADTVLQAISAEPAKLTLSALSKKLSISKSTLFSLLQAMEQLQWVFRNKDDTFSLGHRLGILGSAYFQQYDLISEFRLKSQAAMLELKESIQLAKLEGRDILYLDKAEYPSHVQMVSRAGVKFPAHATGLGKVLLSVLTAEQLERLLPAEELPKITEHTIASRNELLREIRQIRQQGYATDIQEGVMGFCCVAAPVYQPNGEMIAAVSCSMPLHHWEDKKAEATRRIGALAKSLSLSG